MAAGNSSLNLALRITADLNEAKQAVESLTDDIKTAGTTAQASNQQWQATTDAQGAAADATRNNATAQQSLNTELQNSVLMAQRAARSAEEVTAAQNAQSARGHALYQQEQKAAQAQEAAAKAAEAHGKEVEKLKKDLDSLLGSIDPTAKALGKLDAQEAQLRKSRKAGLIDDGTFNDYLGKLGTQREAIDLISDGTEKLSLNSRAAGRELRVLAHQLVNGNWRDASNNILSLGNRTGMLPPLFSATTLAIGGTIGAVAGAGVVVANVLRDQDEFNHSIQLTGNYAGVTAGQLEMMTQAGGQLGSNYSQVRDILNGLVSSGKFTGETLDTVSQAASAMAQLTGDSADQVVAQFVKMTDSVSDWAVNSSEQYHWLDSETYQRIRALEDQGRKEDAIELASQAYKKAAIERLGEIETKLNWVARGWKNVKDAAAEAYAGLKSGIRSALNLDSPEEARAKEIQDIKQRLNSAGSEIEIATRGEGYARQVSNDKKRLAALESEAAAQQKIAAEATKRQQIEDKSNAASKELEKTWANNRTAVEKEADALDLLKKRYTAMWAAAGGRDKLQDLGVTSTDGQSFSGGQWDTDVKALDQSGKKAEQYNKQLQQTLNQKKALTQLARVEADISNGSLKDASKAEQNKARALAKQIDAQTAANKSAKSDAAETKKSFNENQRFVEQLEKQASKRVEGAAATRAQEIATRNLTAEQRKQAEAANAAITAQEFKNQNLQLQLQYMRDTGDTAGASLLETQSRFADMRREFEASGNTKGLSLLDQLLPVAETKIRVDDLKKQLDDLFAYQAQQETSIQAQVQGGLLNEIQGRQRLVELHQEVGDKVKGYLPQLKEMANAPGEAGEKVRDMIRQLELQLDKLNQAGNELTIAFRDGLQSGIESSLMGLAKGTMSLSDAVKNLALTIINSMAQIAAQQLAQMATSSLVGSSGGMGGVLGSLFAADGGHIRGPGTTTSDSIPAMLSDYEFVTRAAVVQQPGALDFLHDFNRHGMAALEGYLPRARHATGGLAGLPAPVASAPSSVPDTSLAGPSAGPAMLQPLQQTLVFDAADAFAKGVESVEGGRSLMTVLRANAPTLKQMLGVK
ncbi:TPA: phage tail tape-measure protein [Klebsiella pneumoniae]|uniref:phage tail length tape measure family protein n=1 Tax=Serratia marcescens TaxID=615 RepID=UPI000D928126|nr:phage tail length tape measure family protein [Serratia marcescens]SQC25606.1 Prophage tail length tape measure [Klebsiella pneumoniae]STS65861.1 Prophage tail length tape measure [Klebsiella pneumoniae]STS69873.1 Prophage tail length tape measure [Klebsiella pneumoniae]SUY90188.1 Prophage tail length tape measure [Klebsiella pneumoniae]HBY9747092.1 phage tail tape-measure protein [Klebsiella pneumoniae]